MYNIINNSQVEISRTNILLSYPLFINKISLILRRCSRTDQKTISFTFSVNDERMHALLCIYAIDPAEEDDE